MAPLRGNQHTLTGVYALDALDTDAEVARFERHMAKCRSCTSEVRGFRQTATQLGLAASRPPPPTLRAAVMDGVARTRQLPAPGDRARHGRPASRLPWLPRLALAGAAIGLAAAITLGVLLVNTQNELSQTRHQIVVTARGLPVPRAGQVYQLWLIGSNGNKIRSEGLLTQHNGRTGPVLISGVLRGDIFGVTVEPPGGTVQPTVKPFIAIPA